MHLGIMAFLTVLTLMLGTVVARIPVFMSAAIVVGIVIFIISFVSTQAALYILIFATLLSPEFGSRTTSGSGVTVRLDDFLLLLISFSQLTRAALNTDIGLFTWTPLNRYITYYMLACVVSTGFGIVFGRVNFLTGFFFVLKYFEYFIVYFLLLNNLESKKQAHRYLTAILCTAAIVSIMAIAQIPTGRRVVAPFEGEDGEPNTLGGYLLLISSVVCGLLLCKNAIRAFRLRILLILLLGLMGIPILFTLSRATWLSAIPLAIGFFILSDRKIVVFLVLLAALIAAPFAMPQQVKDRLFYTVTEEQNLWARKQQEAIGDLTFDTSSSARIKSWKAALNDFPKHPIIGFGVTGWRFIDAQFLRVLLETGLLGFTAFLLLLWAVLRHTWQIYRTTPDPLFKGISLGFLLGTCAMITHALMANTFIIVRIMEPFWLLAALVLGSPNLVGDETDQEQVSPQPTRRLRTFT